MSAAIACALLVGAATGGAATPPTDGDGEATRALFVQDCAPCHGVTGAGDGEFAHRLLTKPPDFTTGRYKFRSAAPDPPGLLHDVARSITEGIPTTPMLPQAQLSEDQALALAGHVVGLARRAPSEESVAGVAVPEAPAPSEEMLRQGKALYWQMACPRCHGDQGHGDGPSATTQTDAKGRIIRPRDLAYRPRKTGDRVEDLYRVFVVGLPGTPMPAFADALPEADRWALAQYVDSLGVRLYERGRLQSIGEEADALAIATRAAEALEARGGIRAARPSSP